MKKLLDLLKNRDRKATYVEKTPQDVYRDVAHNFDQFEPDDIAKIGGLESQHGKFDKPLQGGSARGLFQFQPETAEHLIPGSSESLSDMNTQAELMKEYLRRNDQDTIEDAYTLHNLGATGGKKLLNADDEAPIESAVSRQARAGNKGLYQGKNVGDVKKTIQKKLDEGGKNIDIDEDVAEKFKKTKSKMKRDK